MFNKAASEVFCSRTTLSSDLVAVVDASEAASDEVATADSLRAAESSADPCSLNEADSDTETLTDVEVLADVDALADSVVDSVVEVVPSTVLPFSTRASLESSDAVATSDPF